jgi:hypothetical protein
MSSTLVSEVSCIAYCGIEAKTRQEVSSTHHERIMVITGRAEAEGKKNHYVNSWRRCAGFFGLGKFHLFLRILDASPSSSSRRRKVINESRSSLSPRMQIRVSDDTLSKERGGGPFLSLSLSLSYTYIVQTRRRKC